jgi:hypothetical protein
MHSRISVVGMHRRLQTPPPPPTRNTRKKKEKKVEKRARERERERERNFSLFYSLIFHNPPSPLPFFFFPFSPFFSPFFVCPIFVANMLKNFSLLLVIDHQATRLRGMGEGKSIMLLCSSSVYLLTRNG